MSTVSALIPGRIVSTPFPKIPVAQRGGKRPPHDRGGRRRSTALARLLTPRRYRHLRNWLQFCGVAGVSAALTVAVLSTAAYAQETQALPNLAGTYACEGDETACSWSGFTFTVKQDGADLEIRNEKGEVGNAKLTSPISLSAGPIWNMLGVIVSSDNSVIQWSNGTNWRKK
jgi:hypothetical protein